MIVARFMICRHEHCISVLQEGTGMEDLTYYSATGSANRWTDAVNMGKPLNTSYDDLFITMIRTGGKVFLRPTARVPFQWIMAAAATISFIFSSMNARASHPTVLFTTAAIMIFMTS